MHIIFFTEFSWIWENSWLGSQKREFEQNNNINPQPKIITYHFINIIRSIGFRAGLTRILDSWHHSHACHHSLVKWDKYWLHQSCTVSLLVAHAQCLLIFLLSQVHLMWVNAQSHSHNMRAFLMLLFWENCYIK